MAYRDRAGPYKVVRDVEIWKGFVFHAWIEAM